MKQYGARSISRRILHNPLCAKVFKADRDTFVVGGYVRDIITRGIHSRDIDFAVKKPVRPTVSAIAKSLNGTVVELRAERMHRIALPGGRTLDFSKMAGDIGEDLGGRDFTMNAMAWSPSTGLVDPLGGLSDFRKGAIKAVSRNNLMEDPLRLLRAYRFSAELDMPIETATRKMIRHLAGRIRTSARERITLEFFKLLNAKNPIKSLEEALEDGLLREIIPLNNRQLRDNIKLMHTSLSKIENRPERLFFKDFSQGLTRRGLLRLEILMLGARIQDSLLSVSSDIRKRLQKTGTLYNSFKTPIKTGSSELFELFTAAGDAAEDLLIISGNINAIHELKRFRRINTRPLLSANEVMELSGLRSGPRLGVLIREIKRLHFTGPLRTKRAARKLILAS